MCLAVPTKIVKIEKDQIAEVVLSGVRMKVSLALLPEAKLGDYVLVHVGYAINILSEEEAKETLKLLSELEKEKADGKNIRVIYSPIDALNLAKENPEKDFVLFGVGFETTTPMIAHTIKVASKKRIKNFYVYSVHKLIPPALKVLVKDENIKINGFLCPGHVSVIIGSNPYEFIARDYK
ncbi:unnamed protein product, partial [marine sediment metagenome]